MNDIKPFFDTLYHRLVLNSRKLSRLYALFFRDVQKKHDLTKAEKDILLFFHNNPTYNTASDLVEHRFISKSLVSMSIDSLEKREFIEKTPSPEDRRFVRLSLTDKVAPILQELVAAQQSFFSELQSVFSPEEYKQITELIDRMTENVERSIQRYE